MYISHMYNLNIFFDHHLPLSSKLQSLETFMRRNRNWREISTRRVVLRPRASRKQTWAEGVVDKAVEISGRIIGVRLNWLDRESDGKIQRRNFSPSRVYILNRGGGWKLCEPRLFEKNLYFPCPPFFLLFRGHLKGKRKGKREEEEEEFALMHIARKNRPRI